MIKDFYGLKEADDFYWACFILMSDKKLIHQRIVYDSLTFLGDAGGVYGSMMAIGYFLYYTFVGSNLQTYTLLHQYFKTGPKNTDQDNSSKSREPQTIRQPSQFYNFLLNTGLYFWCKTCFLRSRKDKRYERMLGIASKRVEQALDLRMLIKQSCMIEVLLKQVF